MALQISNKSGDPVNPGMIGLFFEDINFAADGGLYAEMIENRSFEAREAFGTPGRFYMTDDFSYAWSPYAAEPGEKPRFLIVTGTPLSEVNPHYMKLMTTSAGQGIRNQAYDGINLKKGMRYHVSFYARNVDPVEGNFIIKIEKNRRCYASGQVAMKGVVPFNIFTDLNVAMHSEAANFEVPEAGDSDFGPNGERRASAWNRYELTITAEDSVRGADFILAMDTPGCVDLDLISMIPDDAVEGVFRRDLFEALAELKPGFIRFPGGCIVEGISLANRYRWKNTVGENKDRVYNQNLWAFDDDRSHRMHSQRLDPHYGQSYGIGFYEYFLLCEKLGAKALPVLNVGLACQFRSTQVVPIDTPEFQTYVQDALDLIEFANGPADSEWGSLRAKMGHPAPFNLTMISIGNEQWETKFVDFGARYERFESAIHAAYPDILLLGSAGPAVHNPLYDMAWDFYRGGEEKKENFCFAVDEHYYVPPKWLYENVDFYDDYPRNVAVFSGEYASHTADRENSMEAALSEAAFLTGVEKNAGVVKLASYAPLFNRIGHSQWKPDLIWFADEKVYRTPSYYVQKFFSVYSGEETIPMDGQEKELRGDGIYVSLERKGENVILKAVNAGQTEYTLDLIDEASAPIRADAGKITMVSGGEKDEMLPETVSVTEENMKIDGSVLLAPQSVNVYLIQQ